VKHRTDIDGLRAVAVLSVFAYHLKMPQAPGGFVGVDVFFVISGYLIGSQILAGLEEGRFSIAQFYSRRFRRILPALTVMLAIVTAAACYILYPSRLVDYARSLAATALSASNFYFWLKTNYFDAPAATKPLLHTWSLGVEEQFYLVLPPLLILGRRLLPGRLAPAVWTTALASFAASVVCSKLAPGAAFYLLPTRAWQLLLGVLIGMHRFPAAGRGLREAATATGLALIAGTVLTLREGQGYLGPAALPACLGAALVIWAGTAGPTLAAGLLSLRPMVFVGLISYSLYLWHWPIITLQKIYVGHEMFRNDKAIVIALAFVAATLSWIFVEQPLRRGPMPLRRVYAGAAAATMAAAAVAAALVGLKGLAFRYPPQVAKMASYLDYSFDRQFRSGSCFLTWSYGFEDFQKARCLTPVAGKRNILLLGDSHGAHLYYGLSTMLPDVNVLQATATGCKPTVTRRPGEEKRCAELMDYVFKRYLPGARLDAVLISAEWTPEDVPEVAKTLDWARAAHVPVVLSGPIVERDVDLPLLLARQMREGRGDLTRAVIRPAQRVTDRELARIAARRGVPYVSVYRTLCDEENDCLTTAADGAPLQFDYGHLTPEGSQYVVREGVLKTGVLDQVKPPLAAR
jgi:peptidoglycan/LPS O-acetylase OafA/YrhL